MLVVQKYLIPKTLVEALKYAGENEGNFKYLAGGTDIMANQFLDNETSPCIIDISKISELTEIKKTKRYLKIGPLVKLDNLKEIPTVKSEFPEMIIAADSVASPIIRKSGVVLQ